MERTCLKCGTLNTNSSGEPLEACPQCQAIYSRVESALRPKAGVLPNAAAALSAPSVRRLLPDPLDYVETVRSESVYPTYRSLVSLLYVLMLVVAACIAIGALIALFSLEGSGRFWGLVTGMFFSIFIIVFARLFRESALMVCDLSDASIRTAAYSHQLCAKLTNAE